MKRWFLLPLLFLFFSCSQFLTQEKYSIEIPIIEVENNNSVVIDNVRTFVTEITGQKPSTRLSGSTELSIEPLVDIFGDTILFVANLHPGWMLISSDTRTPAILAESPVGHFDLSELTEAEAEWLEVLAEDVRSVKLSEVEEPGCIISGDELNNSEFWFSICDPEAFASQRFPSTRSDEGYYLISTHVEEEIVQEVPHLMQTTWFQQSPFNAYTPYRTDTTLVRAPAGCVAVAGAQMLYYLHGKINRPLVAPTQGYCNGVIGSYSQGFSGFSSSAFDNMLVDDDLAALLIGWVGQNLDVQYGNEQSSASTSDLVDVFEDLGISCQYGAYDTSVVASHLMDEMPVIVRADGTCHTILGIPFYHDGHSFVVDGFRKKRYKYTRTYVWSWLSDEPDSLGIREFDFDDSYIDISYSSPFITQVKINWGWCISQLPYYFPTASYYTWYTLSGNWHIQGSNPQLNFDYRRKMLYNFSVL